MTEDPKWAFLTSVRFWQLALAGIAAGLNIWQQSQNWVLGVTTAIGTWLGGSVVVRTIDRVSDKKVEAAEIASGSLDN